MKFLLIAVTLVAAVSARTTPSHTLEVGRNGVVGSSILSPLISIMININNALGNLVSVEGLPTETVVTPVLPESVSVVEEALIQPQPVIIIDQAPEIVTIVEQAPVQPQPIIVVDQTPEVVTVVDQAPETVTIVDQIQSEPAIVVDQAAGGVVVVDQIPETVIVGPAAVAPAEGAVINQSSPSITNNFLINVVMVNNESSSSSGPIYVASGPLNPEAMQQFLGFFRPLASRV